MENLENIQEKILSQYLQQLNNTFDNIIIESLKLKGYEFKNRLDLENFILNNCSCAKDLKSNQTTYYVNQEPFLLHVEYKNPLQNLVEIEDNNTISFKCDLGYYKTL